jgi:formylmethanofuran dehydrogenase subunit A
MSVKMVMDGIRVSKLGIHAVQHADPEIDPRAYDVCWDNWPIFSKVKAEDVRLLKALIAIRVLKLRKNNRIIANFTPRT